MRLAVVLGCCAMAEPTDRLDQLRQALADLLPDYEGGPIVPEVLVRASHAALERYSEKHRRMHADIQRGGAVVWGMRERGMSWREIYDATGIIQRTAARWMSLFLAEGIAAQPAAELDERLQGGAADE